jgi:hypothetical protein
MKIIAIEKEIEGKSAEDFHPHLRAEARRAWELYLSGYFRELYFRQDQHTAVLILECTDLDQAREILETLPLVREKLISFEIIPLVPYPGFSRLFAD